MAFALTGLKADGYLPGANMKYGYSTADSQATVAGAGYFNGAVDYLRVGDQILVQAGLGGTMVARWYEVTANTGTAITVVKHDIT